MARSFTREEFYKLVWSKPLTHLAKEFYISDVALHKICRKHDIPNPPLGWWAKKEAGKPVEQTPLPKARAGASREIIIANADLSKEAATLSAVREQARVQASSGDDADDGPQHPIIARTLAALRKAKNAEKGLVSVSGPGLIHCTVAPASIDRIAIGLPRIVRAIALQGFQLVEDEGRVRFASEAESLGFSITETVGREAHVLTPSERKEQEAFEKRRERARRRPWDDSWEMPPRFQEWDYRPTGQLAIELEQVWGKYGRAQPFGMAKFSASKRWPATLLLPLQSSPQPRLTRGSSRKRRSESGRKNGTGVIRACGQNTFRNEG